MTLKEALKVKYWERRKRARTSISSKKVKDAEGLIQLGYCLFFYNGRSVYFESGAGEEEYQRLNSLFIVEHIKHTMQYKFFIKGNWMDRPNQRK